MKIIYKIKRFIQSIKFVLTFEIDTSFIVYDFKNQGFMSFAKYEEAKSFSESQFEYNPKILVRVEKK